MVKLGVRPTMKIPSICAFVTVLAAFMGPGVARPETPQAGAAKPATTTAKKPAKTKVAKGAPKTARKPKTAGTTKPEMMIASHRDPFKIPPLGPPGETPGTEEALNANLPPGTAGLVISQIRLAGIVRMDLTNKMIAVVANKANRAYFLHENDSVYNGVVSKITPDSVIFNENQLDRSGQLHTSEVVMRLGSGPGERR